MEKVSLIPLEGIMFENGELIRFETSKEELIQKLGKPDEQFENQLFYDDLEVRIDLDEEDSIEFIEFIYGPFPEKVELDIYDINPFKLESSTLLEILTAKNKGEIDRSEEPYSYAFLESSVGIYRDSCEEDVLESIKHLKSSGDKLPNEEYLKEELEKAKLFWTIGIGRKDYYR